MCVEWLTDTVTVVNAATGAVKRLASGRFSDDFGISPDSRQVAVATDPCSVAVTGSR